MQYPKSPLRKLNYARKNQNKEKALLSKPQIQHFQCPSITHGETHSAQEITLNPIHTSPHDDQELLVVHAKPMCIQAPSPEPREIYVNTHYNPKRIHKTLRVRLQIGGAYTHARGKHCVYAIALIDTGSGKSYMCHPRWNLSASPQKSPIHEGMYQDMEGRVIPIVETIHNVPLGFGHDLFTTANFQLIRMSPTPKNPYDIILGVDFLTRHRATIQFSDPTSQASARIEIKAPLPNYQQLWYPLQEHLCTLQERASSKSPNDTIDVVSSTRFRQLSQRYAKSDANTTLSPHVALISVCVPSQSTRPTSTSPRDLAQDPEWPIWEIDSLVQTFDLSDIIHDPFMLCPSEVMEHVNVPRADCAQQLRDFQNKEYPCFSGMPHESKISRKHEHPMSIELKDEWKEKTPPRGRTYKTPAHLLVVLKKSLTEMLKAGWIRPSRSEWCAPVLIIPKPHQNLKELKPDQVKYRVCVDLSDLNTRTKTLYYRVPDVTTAWDKLSSAKYFSVLDLEKGFWQSKLNATDGTIEKTAFGCEYGRYEFVTAPMGAKNSPAHFQEQIENMLRRAGLMDLGVLRVTGPETIKLINDIPCAHPHIDDLIIYSATKADHVRDLHRVCTALSDEMYYCNRDKCYFFVLTSNT